MVQLEPNRFYSGAEIQELIKKQRAEGEKTNPLKRGPDTANANEASHNDDDDDDESSDNEILITDNCDQIRRKIRTFTDNSGMSIKDFLDALNVSSGSYYGFMKQHGKDKGFSSDTYLKAMRFVQKRAQKGLPIGKKRKVTTTTATPAFSKTSTSRAAAAAKISDADIANIQLNGEATDSVPIFDSCDEIRRKINAHLRKPGVTQAQFMRDLHAQLHGPRRPKSLQAAQLNKFRSQRGALTGNSSGIYYAAYVFFEKRRVAAGAPKTEHREDMEDEWEIKGGVDVKTIFSKVTYICTAGRQVGMDDLGRVRVY